MATGELHTRPDPDDLVAQTLGPLFFRRVVADQPADDNFIDHIIDDALTPARSEATHGQPGSTKTSTYGSSPPP